MTEESIIKVYFDEVTNHLRDRREVRKRSEEFGKLKSDSARVQYMLNLEAVTEIVKVPGVERILEKSLVLAEQYRIDGNKKFEAKNYRDALNLYNKSVIMSPNDEGPAVTNLSLAYGNRSAALFHMKKYKYSLADISRAFDNKYPQKLHYKLYERRAKCYLELKDFDLAVTAVENAKNSLDWSELDSKKKAQWHKQFTKTLSLCRQQDSGLSHSVQDLSLHRKSPPMVHGSSYHPNFTSLSKSCDVSYSAESGRYVVASQDLRPSDVVLVEKPFASVLLPEHYDTHCDQCYARLVTFVSCSSCCVVAYCSEECRDIAVNGYHRYECSELKAIHRSGKFEHLALRSITCKSAVFFKCFKESVDNKYAEIMKDGRLRGCDSNGQYSSQDYNTIYNLVTHSEQRSTHDLFYRALAAVYLLKCLQRSSFFSEIEEDLEEFEVFIGGLILSHLQSFPINAHEISELMLDEQDIVTSTSQEVGAGIYATLSLFNHSCDPAVTRNFYGSSCVVRALRAIRPGEELSDNYGAVFAVQVREERWDKLQQYYFKCQCVACQNDWPLYTEIRCEDPLWNCGNCRSALTKLNGDGVVKCSSCGKNNNLSGKEMAVNEAQEKYLSGLDELLELHIQAAQMDFIEALVIYGQHVQTPWKDVNNSQEALKQCLNTLGNCHVVREKH